ncbi:MAG: hypothetical protein AAB646_01870, partial [Patescibacteria group bacterium]
MKSASFTGPVLFFTMLVFLGLVIITQNSSPKIPELDSTKLHQLIEKNEVLALRINPESRIVIAVLKDGGKKRSVVSDPQALEKFAISKGVSVFVEAKEEQSFISILFWSIAPLLLLAALFFLIIRRTRSGNMPVQMGDGFQIIKPGKIDKRFNDIAGCDEIKKELELVVDF